MDKLQVKELPKGSEIFQTVITELNDIRNQEKEREKQKEIAETLEVPSPEYLKQRRGSKSRRGSVLQGRSRSRSPSVLDIPRRGSISKRRGSNESINRSRSNSPIDDNRRKSIQDFRSSSKTKSTKNLTSRRGSFSKQTDNNTINNNNNNDSNQPVTLVVPQSGLVNGKQSDDPMQEDNLSNSPITLKIPVI